MPNSLYTATQVAKTAVALAAANMRLSALVGRNMEDDLIAGGGKGRTVNLRVPPVLVARARDIDDTTNKIVTDYVSETTVPLTLGTLAYSSVGLSEGDMLLDLEDFGAQVLAPQVDAVVSYFEDMVTAAIDSEADAAEMTAASWTYSASDPVKTFTRIRRVLVGRGVPVGASLNVAVGSKVYEDLLNAGAIQDASQSGSTAALRDGMVGRVRGMNIVEAPQITETKVVAWLKEGFQLAARAPKVPQGAPFGQTIQGGPFALRYLRDYDADYTQDRSIVSTYGGIVKMPLYKVTRTQPVSVEGDTDTDGAGPDGAYVAGSATITPVTGGAVVAWNCV